MDMSPFKDGDHVTLVLDENDTLIDVHPEGQKGRASICDGKLIHLGKSKRKSNWQLLKAKRYSRVANLEGKTKGIKERTAVTVEVNEAGTVIDVHRGQATLSTHEALLFRTGKRPTSERR